MTLIETLQERVVGSELGKESISDPFMEEDTWALRTLGYTEEQCCFFGRQHIHFNRISLPWLKYLAKLTIKARVRERCSLSRISADISSLSQLDAFLVARGCADPISISNTLLNEFIAVKSQEERRRTLVYALQLWAEEGWLRLSFIPTRNQKKTPKVEIIPEEVLYQIYESLDLFPLPLERLFRLQMAIGCRLIEMLTMPRHCLKQEGNQWFLLRWIAKRQCWQFYAIHPLVVELVKEQQRFLDTQFGSDSNFDKLFCKVSVSNKDGALKTTRFKTIPIYQPSYMPLQTTLHWLRAFVQEADLKDKYGNRFRLTSHMFRRTKASVMAHCETGDEYIAAVLGHSSLDMLPHYRKYSLERLEREAETKGYVDMYGRVTTYKPEKLRYEKLVDLLKVSTPLGECHRPTMLGDCQHRYACLSCQHHHVTLDDRSQLEADQKHLQQDLRQAQGGSDRRITEIERLLNLVDARLKGLNQLETVRERITNEKP
jgi:integrase